jgi:DNA-binding NarL/FixJ family response regulator
MRTRNVSVPTVVLSNLSQMEDEKKATALGAVGYLSKSNTSMAVVIAKVNSILS